MKTIKDINELVQKHGGAGAFNRGYGNALEDVLELVNNMINSIKYLNPLMEELRDIIKGEKE